MVHYGSHQSERRPVPLLCPKCGSHRTAVVGKSADEQHIAIRCSACGARSEIVLTEHDASAAAHDVEAGA
jgi:hypothetical protein